MARVRIIKKSGEYSTGQIVTVSNNDAHTLIENGVATMNLEVKPKRKYNNKMMESR